MLKESGLTIRQITDENLTIPQDESIAPTQLLERFGNIDRICTEHADIVILPTCDTPLEYLDPEQWVVKTPMGNRRIVFSIDKVRNGTNPHIVCKSPERVFTKDPTLLSKRFIWWGGPRSGEQPITFGIHPAIEGQVALEAAMLLELHKHGIPAELPQAIHTYPNGTKSLIVKHIQSGNRTPNTPSPRYDALIDKARHYGLLPEDTSHRNSVRDQDGQDTIIDVNRWRWPPYTDVSTQIIIQLIQESQRNS